MVSDRKRVTIRSANLSWARAIRHVLPEFEVTIEDAATPDTMERGIRIWRSEIGEEDLLGPSIGGTTLVVAPASYLIPAVDAGCRGFLPESASLDQVRKAVLELSEGGAVIPPDLLGTLLRHLVDRRRAGAGANAALADLTDREREVFHLAARGASRDEIAERLYISPATARTHLQRIYRKLGVHSQAQLVGLAIEIGELEAKENS